MKEQQNSSLFLLLVFLLFCGFTHPLLSQDEKLSGDGTVWYGAGRINTVFHRLMPHAQSHSPGFKQGTLCGQACPTANMPESLSDGLPSGSDPRSG